MLNVANADLAQVLLVKQLLGDMRPGFPIPDISDGLRADAILRSEYHAIANFLSHHIREGHRSRRHEFQPVNFSGLISREDISGVLDLKLKNKQTVKRVNAIDFSHLEFGREGW
jgi:hypothetical protein